MLQKIIDFSVRKKLVIGLFIIALISWGSYEVTQLPIDALPDITDNQVQVITVSPSLGATDIERLITFPIEQSCSNIAGLKQVRSFSRFGLSLVTLVFTDETDIHLARQQISEQLQKVKQELPNGIGSPELAPLSTGLGEIYQYVIRPKEGYEDQYGPMELRTIQDWTVRRQLLGTPGVAEVSSFGGKLKQYEIAVRQEQLKAHNLSITDLFDALERNNENTGGAYIEKGPTVLYIRSEGLTRNISDIQQIVLKNLDNGTPLLIRDVAEVRFGSAIRYGAMTFNTKGEVAGAVVMMLKGENSSNVVKRVKKRIEEIQKMLPEGVVIEPFLDRTKMVNNAIRTVETNLMEGALIVIFVLVFFLGNLRAGLIVSSVIPLSMLFAIILMNLFGVGGNLMSLGAIDFGLIVDGSVIVVEVILHRFSHSKQFKHIQRIDQTQMDHEVTKSTGSMIKSAVFSQIIILIVYLPILSLQGIEGKMFKPMALTIVFAILGAFLLSVTYVPMMSALFLNKKIAHKKNITDRLMIWLERKYQPALNRLLRFPKTILATTFLIFGLAVYLLLQMGGEFIPQLEEGDFAVETRLLTGSNLNNTIESTQKASKILLERFPEVTKIVTKIGSAEVPTDPMPFEAGDMMVILKDKKEWTSAASFPELSEKMTKALEEVPGITVGFQFPVQMRFNELMTGARQDVVCKIYGENLDSLTQYAHRLAQIIGTVKGAITIYEEKMTGMPQVVITYNRQGMAKYGLNVGEVNRIVNAAFAGQTAGQVYEGEKRFDLVVRLDGKQRDNISDIQNLMVQTSNNTQIPLSYVAKIEEVEGVNQIQRENTKRRIIVGFNVSGRDVQSIVQELQQKVSKKLNLSKEYSIVYGGSFENMTAAKARLSIVVPIALLLIFLLLFFAFNSVKQGLLIYTAIPLSAIGGIIALWLRDMPFSISAGVGFIALFGVAVLNGILLVSEFNRLKKEGWKDVKRIVIHATKSKLRAVLMTALVPSLGFIPMAISTGAGGEVQKPLATVVIGGLIISTMLTLFVLPVLYIIAEKGFSYFKSGNQAPKMIALLFIFGGLYTHAQQSITLQAAIDSAVKNNNYLKVSEMQVKYAQALTKSGFDIPQTEVGFEYGQFNSKNLDNKWLISQTIQFPTVYRNQERLVQTTIRMSEIRFDQNVLNLEIELKRVFYEFLLLEERRKLLLQADSMFSGLQQKLTQRFENGDLDILEKAAADNQRIQVANQLNQLETGSDLLVLRFNILLNTQQTYLPDLMNTDSKYVLLQIPDTNSIDKNPVKLLGEQELLFSRQQIRLEKSKLLPSLSAGFSSATIIGWQTPYADPKDLYFNASDRFSSFSAGIGIPLFWGSQKRKVQAANVFMLQKEQELKAIDQQLKMQFISALKTYDRTIRLLESFDNSMLPNSETVIKSATEKLHSGEIGYIDWVVLVNQAMQTKSDYFLAIQQLNEAAFEIERISPLNK
ncbi:CusA/CzcA family heavy metal efflux RND transporter [uncultured Fluviicola sp.]|uniref:CusA/CzcA family heavy metal efflux RND transporter n=1 Tax=uncultured Fluviicola sp. TaxID=463303 RepID=UPI0025FFF047|nr:CusA/CzcA family heavy metal efflux RND transporter [uncultured Fluviicola sp.]